MAEARALQDDSVRAPMRERKKRRTRETILSAAMTLFRERGYDQVTVEQVAMAADISTRTFYHYFSAKEDLVLQFHTSDLEELVNAIRSAPKRASAIEVVMTSMARGIPESDQALMTTRFEIMNQTPGLQSKLRARRAMWADEIAAVLIERRHFGGDAAMAGLLGRCVVSATQTAVEAHVHDPSAGSVSDHLHGLLEVLAVGFEAAERRGRR